MIRTAYGQTKILADSRGEIMGDFACVVKAIEGYFIEEEGATKEQAKEEIMKIVERTFAFEEDSDNTDELMDLLDELLKVMKKKEGKKDE